MAEKTEADGVFERAARARAKGSLGTCDKDQGSRHGDRTAEDNARE